MTNTKKIKKFLFLTPVAGAILVALPTLTSCSLFTTKIPASASSLHQFMKSSSQIDWISKRSMSLKFVSSNNAIGYGTGWIFSKNPNKKASYYIATNLHVASFLQNQGKTIYSSLDGGNTYIKGTGLTYPKIEIGIVGKKTLNNTFIQGTSDSFMSYENGGFHYVGSIQTVNTNIVYAGHQMFPKSGTKYLDPFNVRGANILNGTLDFALIEMDFSNFLPAVGYPQNIMPNFLANYDANPTIFAQEPGNQYTNLYIGGFPYDNSIFNPTDTILGAPKNPIWIGLSNVSVSSIASGISLKINKPNINGVSAPYSNVAVANEIPFVADGFASYRNVGLQGLMSGIDIGGGSSGSMVVNQNNEVVGIYWGTYTLSNGYGSTKIVGGLDYFYSDTNYFIKVENRDYPCYRYNLLEHAQNYLGVQNLQNPIWTKTNQ